MDIDLFEEQVKNVNNHRRRRIEDILYQFNDVSNGVAPGDGPYNLAILQEANVTLLEAGNALGLIHEAKEASEDKTKQMQAVLEGLEQRAADALNDYLSTLGRRDSQLAGWSSTAANNLLRIAGGHAPIGDMFHF